MLTCRGFTEDHRQESEDSRSGIAEGVVYLVRRTGSYPPPPKMESSAETCSYNTNILINKYCQVYSDVLIFVRKINWRCLINMAWNILRTVLYTACSTVCVLAAQSNYVITSNKSLQLGQLHGQSDTPGDNQKLHGVCRAEVRQTDIFQAWTSTPLKKK